MFEIRFFIVFLSFMFLLSDHAAAEAGRPPTLESLLGSFFPPVLLWYCCRLAYEGNKSMTFWLCAFFLGLLGLLIGSAGT